jgi:5-methylcytosine-specific restriction endonuclease McrA
MGTYHEELKDPRWDKKRKKILKRDGYKCTACGGKGELHVHHTYYVKNYLPWAYPDDSLLTLCSLCHHNYHITHEITELDNHIPNNPKPKPKHNKPSHRKKRPKAKDPSISQKKSKRRHNNYAWDKAIKENIERLKKLS